jgi:hypothetical protein
MERRETAIDTLEIMRAHLMWGKIMHGEITNPKVMEISGS